MINYSEHEGKLYHIQVGKGDIEIGRASCRERV